MMTFASRKLKAENDYCGVIAGCRARKRISESCRRSLGKFFDEVTLCAPLEMRRGSPAQTRAARVPQRARPL